VQRPEVLAVLTDSELIEEELRQQLLRCQCPSQFPVQKIELGKYKVYNPLIEVILSSTACGQPLYIQNIKILSYSVSGKTMLCSLLC